MHSGFSLLISTFSQKGACCHQWKVISVPEEFLSYFSAAGRGSWPAAGLHSPWAAAHSLNAGSFLAAVFSVSGKIKAGTLSPFLILYMFHDKTLFPSSWC